MKTILNFLLVAILMLASIGVILAEPLDQSGATAVAALEEKNKLLECMDQWMDQHNGSPRKAYIACTAGNVTASSVKVNEYHWKKMGGNPVNRAFYRKAHGKSYPEQVRLAEEHVATSLKQWNIDPAKQPEALYFASRFLLQETTGLSAQDAAELHQRAIEARMNGILKHREVRRGDRFVGLDFDDDKSVSNVVVDFKGPESAEQIKLNSADGFEQKITWFPRCANLGLEKARKVQVVEVPEQPAQTEEVRPVPEAPTPVKAVAAEECAFYPTAYVAAGGDISLEGGGGAFLGHLNLGTHCMKKLNKREQLGLGAQVITDASHWGGSANGEPVGTYDTVRPKVVLPSIRYWGISENGEHQYAFLGGPNVGAAITQGGSDNGDYSMHRGLWTAGAGGGWDMYSKEDGKFYKQLSVYGGVDVPFASFSHRHTWMGQRLDPHDLKSTSAILVLGVRHHIVSECRSDMFLGGYRISGQISGFAAFPENAAIGAQLVLNDCNYIFEASVGPTVNLNTGKVSAFGMIGANILEAKRVMTDKGRVGQVERLQQERDNGRMLPPTMF